MFLAFTFTVYWILLFPNLQLILGCPLKRMWYKFFLFEIHLPSIIPSPCRQTVADQQARKLLKRSQVFLKNVAFPLRL